MPRILLIEDDDAQRETYKDILTLAGYSVSDAPDGKVGMQLYRRHPYELVITDIYMPEQDGLETIMILKKEYPTVRIIAVSGGGERMRQLGHSGPGFLLECTVSLGADYILQKPISRQQLLQTVGAVFGA